MPYSSDPYCSHIQDLFQDSSPSPSRPTSRVTEPISHHNTIFTPSTLAPSNENKLDGYIHRFQNKLQKPAKLPSPVPRRQSKVVFDFSNLGPDDKGKGRDSDEDQDYYFSDE